MDNPLALFLKEKWTLEFRECPGGGGARRETCFMFDKSSFNKPKAEIVHRSRNVVPVSSKSNR